MMRTGCEQVVNRLGTSCRVNYLQLRRGSDPGLDVYPSREIWCVKRTGSKQYSRYAILVLDCKGDETTRATRKSLRGGPSCPGSGLAHADPCMASCSAAHQPTVFCLPLVLHLSRGLWVWDGYGPRFPQPHFSFSTASLRGRNLHPRPTIPCETS
jgi:hypothetical protein